MGIYQEKRTGKWGARLQLAGKTLWFGFYATKEEAQKASEEGEKPYAHLRRTWHGFASPKDPKRQKFYQAWRAMRQRCNLKTCQDYGNYGGRGIKCLWRDFQEFRDVMWEPFLEHIRLHGMRKTTLDRIDNDGHYEPVNCRWATPKVQNNNCRPRRHNIRKPAPCGDCGRTIDYYCTPCGQAKLHKEGKSCKGHATLNCFHPLWKSTR